MTTNTGINDVRARIEARRAQENEKRENERTQRTTARSDAAKERAKNPKYLGKPAFKKKIQRLELERDKVLARLQEKFESSQTDRDRDYYSGRLDEERVYFAGRIQEEYELQRKAKLRRWEKERPIDETAAA